MGLTEAEWLKELEALAGRTSDDGLTVAEMAVHMDISERDVRTLLTRAKAEGRLTRGWREAEGLDGRRYKTPVYTVTARPAKPSGPIKGRTKGGSALA